MDDADEDEELEVAGGRFRLCTLGDAQRCSREIERSHVRVETQFWRTLVHEPEAVRTEPVGMVTIDDEKEEAVCCVLGWFSLRHQRTK